MVTVDLPAGVISQLVDYALAMLWQADQQEGCCPKCCNACAALQALDETGQLDEFARRYGRGSFYWYEPADRVNRAWLNEAWRMTGCHE